MSENASFDGSAGGLYAFFKSETFCASCAANRNADDGVVFAFSIAFCTEELFKKALNQVSMLLNCFVKDASEEVFPNISAPFAKTG